MTYSVRAMAAALGVSKSQIARDANAGMPMGSPAAAQAWRQSHRAASRTVPGRIARPDAPGTPVQAAPDCPGVIAKLAHLACVPAGDLEAWLGLRWAPGDEQIAAQRLEALRLALVRKAGAAPRPNAVSAQAAAIRAEVQQLLEENPRRTREAAFLLVAEARHCAWGTIRNAFYSRQRIP